MSERTDSDYLKDILEAARGGRIDLSAMSYNAFSGVPHTHRVLAA
jgi:hypothetical protein